MGIQNIIWWCSLSFVIVTHGFIKKTQKTPAKEIAKAEEKRRMYFDFKKEQ